jgi:hypothetical protein
MPYCGKCLIEYVDGTARCEDCGADLLPGSPSEAPPRVDLMEEKDVKLVPVRVFSGGTAQMDAELARNILQSQGIAAVAQGETAAELLPVLDVPLFVREQDAPRAESILEEYFDKETPTPSEEPDSAEKA